LPLYDFFLPLNMDYGLDQRLLFDATDDDPQGNYDELREPSL